MSNQNAQSGESRGEDDFQRQGVEVQVIASGRVLGIIYRNESQKIGTYYKVSFRRSEVDKTRLQKGKPYRASSFWPEDLGDIASVATQCRYWLEHNTDAFAREVTSAGRKKRSRGPRLHEAYRPSAKLKVE